MNTMRVLIIDDEASKLSLILDGLTQRFAQRNIAFEYDIRPNVAEAMQTLRASNRFDLVFLDIVGVDWGRFLQQLPEVRPYLPVVMLSHQAIPSEMVQCIDSGASSFIFKRDLTPDTVKPLSGQDRARDSKKWEDTLEKIQRLIREYRPIKRLLEAPLEIGLITKSGDCDSVIPDQIEFLKYVQEIPALKPHFPALSKTPWTESGMSCYEMPFYSLKPLRRLILEEMDQEVCQESAKRILQEVLEFAFEKMYRQDRRDDVYPTYSDDTYFAKLKKRIDEAEEATRVPGRGLHIALGKAYRVLLRASRIVIGKKSYRNPTAILHELQRDHEFISVVTPRNLCMIHGDLHFDNILVDDRLRRREAFKLVDPRGDRKSGYQPGVGDPAYDFGKLLHSAHGYYDLIHTGVYAVDSRSVSVLRNGVEVSELERLDWDSASQGGGGSGAKLTTHKRRVQPWVWAAFDSLCDFLIEWVLEKEILTADPSFLLRAYLNEALDFCTMGKFHLKIVDKDSMERVISLHVRGIQLMNDFVTRWKNYKKGDIRASGSQ